MCLGWVAVAAEVGAPLVGGGTPGGWAAAWASGVSRVAAESRLAVGAANFGLVDTVAAFMGDPTALGYWAPENERQVAEDVVVPGGAMLVAFENAWHAGSEKDRAAREKEQASR